MAYKIVYSDVALADMDKAWDEIYEASKDIDIADNYIKTLRVNLKEISKHPRTGERLHYEDMFTGIYYVTHKKYSAFYRIVGDSIQVGRVLYNRSEYIKRVIDTM